MEINLRDKVLLVSMVAVIAIAFVFHSYRVSSIAPCPAPSSLSLHVCFSSDQDCSKEIVDAISKAKSNLLVHAYSSVSTPIAQAILDAKRRGIDVQLILDKSQMIDHNLSARFFVNQGIPTWIEPDMATSHAKAFIIDGAKVITGSISNTQNTQQIVDSVVFINDPRMAKQFIDNWATRKNLSNSAEAFLKINDTYKYRPRHAMRRRYYRFS